MNIYKKFAERAFKNHLNAAVFYSRWLTGSFHILDQFLHWV